MTRTAQARARIAALVAAGPISSLTGYTTLRAEGFNNGTIRAARAGAVEVVGTKKGAWWCPIPPRTDARRKRVSAARRRKQQLAALEIAHQARRERQRRELLGPVADATDRRPVPTAARPLRVPVYCCSCGCRVGDRAAGVEPRCYRELCRPVEQKQEAAA